MEPADPRQDVRRLLADMLAIVDSSPDALTSRYGELRDRSYELACQVRTVALPDPETRLKAFVGETTARKW